LLEHRDFGLGGTDDGLDVAFGCSGPDGG